ncbi:MAG TPA: LamG domain-containing protein, partial [Polyangia bacterium]
MASLLTLAASGPLSGCTGENPAFRGDERDASAAVGEIGAGGRGDSNASAGRGVCPVNSSLAVCVRCEGNLQDESVAHRPMTHAGVTFAPGADGLACVVNGVSSIHAPLTNLQLPDFTIEIWVRPRVLPATGARAGIVDREDAVGVFVAADGSVSCRTGGIGATATAALKATTWTSLACTLGGGNLAMWVNGRRAAVTSATNLTGTATTGSLTVGSNNPSGDPLDGAIDILRIWRGARSAAES